MPGSTKNPFPYYVVQFMSVGRPARTRLMDVVCGSWLSKDRGGGLYVQYPEHFNDKKSRTEFERRLRQTLPAAEDWPKFKVKLRGKSSKLLH